MTKILMCKPTYFDVDYVINPWMNNQLKNVNRVIASNQWNELYNSLTSIASVYLLDPIENLPDMVFTANAGFMYNNTFIVSNFANIERKPEEIYFEDYFKELNYKVVRLHTFYEGEGDHLVDKQNRHWVGTGFRTAKSIDEELKFWLNTEITILELIDPRWYHLDTCFCPLPNGEIYWYPNAFSSKSQEIILNSFDTHIFAKEEDALMFSCNSVCIENNIFMPHNNYGYLSLERLGYKVHQFDLSEFIKAGGAAKCLTLFF